MTNNYTPYAQEASIIDILDLLIKGFKAFAEKPILEKDLIDILKSSIASL